MQWSLWFAGLMDIGPDDRMYDCLPMYHSVGGVVATGALLVRGGSVAVREKFSVSQFWDDVADWDCTLFQYIGELCRYLVNAPEHPREREHRLRLACGNGLRADTWEKFQSRFAIPKILEFYAATEGNVSLYNVEGKIGAIGRVPPFLSHRFPLALVKFDVLSGAPTRDAQGRAIRCATDEVGEAIGRIGHGTADAGGEFEGYTSASDTERKILRDVFEAGDAWFRTGDLMRRDEHGFYYFVDRIGDTFRWKGENVATSEVAAALTEFPGIGEATVYGVAVPGTEGAAGMAALVVDRPLDFAELRRHLAKRLPGYARPLFLRLTANIAATSTFKHDKNQLMREGFDVAVVRDEIYFDDPERHAYVPLDAALSSADRRRKNSALSRNFDEPACGILAVLALSTATRERPQPSGRNNLAIRTIKDRATRLPNRSRSPRQCGTFRYGRKNMRSKLLGGAAAVALTACTVLATSAPASAAPWGWHRGWHGGGGDGAAPSRPA